ncbi:hypothetical protein CB1_000128004 [Camelus ferus]|nr:hypothetical protein CB1_000128004 [Camelus ferus]
MSPPPLCTVSLSSEDGETSSENTGDASINKTTAPLKSAWVGEKFYLADMELQANIIKDDCKCVIEHDEPVITLAKERREPWRGLLRQRNPNVAFDFDHWEDCEEDKDSHFSKGHCGAGQATVLWWDDAASSLDHCRECILAALGLPRVDWQVSDWHVLTLRSSFDILVTGPFL